MSSGKSIIEIKLGKQAVRHITHIARSTEDRMTYALVNAIKGCCCGTDRLVQITRSSLASLQASFSKTIQQLQLTLSPAASKTSDKACPPQTCLQAASASPAVGNQPRTSSPPAAPKPDVKSLENEADQQMKLLDNINAHTDLLRIRFKDLREQYRFTFNPDAKNQLLNNILLVKAALATLTRASDATAQKLWRVDDQLQQLTKSSTSFSTHFAAMMKRVAAAPGKMLKGLLSRLTAALKATRAFGTASRGIGKLFQFMSSSFSKLYATSSAVQRMFKGLTAVARGVRGTFQFLIKLSSGLFTAFQRLGLSQRWIRSAFVPLLKLGPALLGTFKRLGAGIRLMGGLFRTFLTSLLSLPIVGQAIQSMGNYIGGLLRSNAELMQSVNHIRTLLAVAFQPIYEAALPAIQALMRALTVATAYAAAFTNALFDKTIQQSFAAASGLEAARNSMDGYGKAAKKTAALAGFDQLNTLDTSTGDTDMSMPFAGPGSAMELPQLDLETMQANMNVVAEHIKLTFQNIWTNVLTGWNGMVAAFGPSFSAAWDSIAPMLELWKQSLGLFFQELILLGDPLKNWFVQGLIPLWQQGIEAAGAILGQLMGVLLTVFNSTRKALMPIWQAFVTDGLPLITELLSGTLVLFQQWFDGAQHIFQQLWSGVIAPVMELISKIIVDGLTILRQFWDTWGTDIVEGIRLALENLKGLWTKLWESFLQPFVSTMLDNLHWLWDSHLKGLIEQVMNFVGKLVTAVTDIFNKFIAPLTGYLIERLGPAFSNIFSTVADIVTSVVAAIIDVIKGLIRSLGGIVDFLAGVFTLDWERAWQGIKDFVAGIFNAVGGIVAGVINILIDLFNHLIRNMNLIKFTVPDWGWLPDAVQGKSFEPNIPLIPKLAAGGLVSGPTLALVGDNPGAAVDPEVVAPLSRLQGMLGDSNTEVVSVLNAMLDVMRTIAGKDTSIKIGETEFARLAARSLHYAGRSTGVSRYGV